MNESGVEMAYYRLASSGKVIHKSHFVIALLPKI